MADSVSANLMNVRTKFFSQLLLFDFPSAWLIYFHSLNAYKPSECRSRKGKLKFGHKQIK